MDVEASVLKAENPFDPNVPPRISWPCCSLPYCRFKTCQSLEMDWSLFGAAVFYRQLPENKFHQVKEQAVFLNTFLSSSLPPGTVSGALM